MLRFCAHAGDVRSYVAVHCSGSSIRGPRLLWCNDGFQWNRCEPLSIRQYWRSFPLLREVSRLRSPLYVELFEHAPQNYKVSHARSVVTVTGRKTRQSAPGNKADALLVVPDVIARRAGRPYTDKCCALALPVKPAAARHMISMHLDVKGMKEASVKKSPYFIILHETIIINHVFCDAARNCP